jgi:hypothetical protein
MRCEICDKAKDTVKNYTIWYGDCQKSIYVANGYRVFQTSEKIAGEISGGVCNSCIVKNGIKYIFLSPISAVLAFIIASQLNGALFLIFFLFSFVWCFISFLLFLSIYWSITNSGEHVLFQKYRKRIKNLGYNGVKLSRDDPMEQFARAK